MNKYFSTNCEAIIGAKQIAIKEIPKYGNIKLKKGTKDCVEAIIQKPSSDQIVSNLALYSQLILTPKIFQYLNFKKTLAELDIGIALNKLAHDTKVLIYEAKGPWCTIGDPLNYLKANITMTLFKNVSTKKDIINYIRLLKF